LIPLVLGFNPQSPRKGEPFYNSDVEKLVNSGGVTAWGLIPFNLGTYESNALGSQDLSDINLTMSEDDSPLDGVIIAVGNSSGNAAAGIPITLANICTSYAVGMDGSDSVMMGAANEHFLPKPPLGKQIIQRYGFYCK